MKKTYKETYKAPESLEIAQIAETLFCISDYEVKMGEEEEDVLWG